MSKYTIAIAGLGCETSTFSPARTRADAFHPKRGDKILDHYAFLTDDPQLATTTWKGALIGHALPGGIVRREDFEQLAGEIVERLRDISRETRLDGLWYDIHGAMCVEGMDDAEAELLRRARVAIGSDVIVSTSMDLHGNVSRDLAHQSDLLTCYRTAPHVDVIETKIRACRNLVDVLDMKDASGSPRRPLKARIPVPVLLAGEQTSTRIEPGKSLYAAVPEVKAREGVLDASIWVGYAWANEPRNRATVVVTGYNGEAVAAGAEKLARLFWQMHADFDFVAPTGTLDACLEAALRSDKRPYFISDSGDNPTAGGAGDVTWTLHQLLERSELKESGRALVYASIPAGREAIRTIVKAGIGKDVTVIAGAEVDAIHAGPVTLAWKIRAIKHGDPHALVEAVVQVGSILVILTELRKPYHLERDFTNLNINIRGGDADIVMVKIGYLEPELYNLAADWMMALTPGGVDQHLERLGHRRIERPMFPLDQHWLEEPDLRARMVPISNELTRQ